MSTKPALRPLDFQPILYEEQQMWLLRDPLRLTDRQLIFPQALAQLLPFIDGTRVVEEIHDDFCHYLNQQVDYDVIVSTLTQLDEACLLENDRARKAKQRKQQQYRSLEARPPALAGITYPADPVHLATFLRQYEEECGNPDGAESWQGRAIVSPHIDYERGGPVYAGVWSRAQAAIAAADLILIFGTDHNGGLGTISLTPQPYATPFGVLPSDREIVEKLSAAIGPENAFDLELNHLEEHSVELSAVWLHYVYHRLGQSPAPMVPILCGSFQHFVSNGHHPAEDEGLNAFVTALQEETAGRKVLAVASVDLAHVGPNFGDSFVIGPAHRRRLAESDKSLIAAVSEGDHARFYEEIAGIQDRNRICGFSSTYLMLRYLENEEPLHGVEVAYEHCPADAQDTSLVSICGLLLA